MSRVLRGNRRYFTIFFICLVIKFKHNQYMKNLTKKNQQKLHKPLSLRNKALKIGRIVVSPLLPRSKWGKRFAVLIILIVSIPSLTMYGLSRWYVSTQRDVPLTFGATFVPNYAKYFELDPQEVFDAMINDLGLERLRLVSYWKDIERVEGTYDFSELDWQFRKAEQAGVEVSLAIGLRQPRWPECHGPEWAMAKPMEEWSKDLKTFMGAVIERYKTSPALKEYQLENEFFLSVFGECPDFTRERLIDEYEFVKALDPTHPVIISRSNNAVGIPINEPTPDKYAVTVYKRVWDKTLTKRYFEYPFPAWFYGGLAGASKLVQNKDLFVHELQTEAWLPEGMSMKTAPIDELYKSLSPERLEKRIDYGVATGMRTIDLWGVEWWYYMKTERNAPELWNTAKDKLESLK